MRKTSVWLFVGAGHLMAGIGYRIFTTYWDFGIAADELPDALRDYRRAGLPWVAADLVSEKVAEKDNAAGLIRQAIAAGPGSRIDRAFDHTFFAGGTTVYLSQYSKALNFLQLAAKRPKLDYHRDWDQGPFLVFDEFSKVKRFARALALRALEKARHGDDKSAIEDLTDARRIAVLTRKEPVIIAALVSVAAERQTLLTAERCLALASDNPLRLSRYRRWLKEEVELPDMTKALHFEVYNSIVFTRNFDRLGGLKSLNPMEDFDFLMGENSILPPSMGMRKEGTPTSIRAQAYMTRHLQAWTELFRKTEGLRADWETIDREWKGIVQRSSESKGLSHQIDFVLFPTHTQAIRKPTELLAARAKALALADTLIERTRTGRWPESVAQIDPFTNRPLRVLINGPDIRIYSIGIDGKDDGGNPKRDLVAAFPPIPSKRPPRRA